MGPRSYERGRDVLHRNAKVHGSASMGPRYYERGMIRGPGSSRPGRLASMGPRSLNAEGLGPTWDLAFHGLLQWGRILTNAEGARTHQRSLRSPASMGPRSYERGRASTDAQGPDTKTVLQWGRGLMNAESAARCALSGPLLQWGRFL